MPVLTHCGDWYLSNQQLILGLTRCSVGSLQNALKVFPDFPPSLMKVVKGTDPATVTQHGLYMRDLSHLHTAAQPSHRETSDCTQAQRHNSMQSTCWPSDQFALRVNHVYWQRTVSSVLSCLLALCCWSLHACNSAKCSAHGAKHAMHEC